MTKGRSLDDACVAREVRAYKEALEAGERPDRKPLLEHFPEIADEITACLDALDFVQEVAPPLRDGSLAEYDLAPSTPLGDFRIVREIGRGGMGVVYEAEQLSLGRRVALKVLPFAAVLDSRYLQRFKNEAQAAANLHHSNIVPVYGVGSDRGVHYYAMQFIEGSTVAGLIDELKAFAGNGKHGTSSAALETIAKERTTESPQFCRAVARLGVQAAEALEYAHESGVIHRDIKPPNLIVEGNGHLWVTDFGLASTSNDTGLTMTGDLVGTLRYMSPEQARAKGAPVDHRTDIYSLGVTLYEFLTLEQAFPGDDPRGVMQEIALKEPTRPRALNGATPPELETILLKAMSKEPADRYPSSRELADDLRRFLEDRPIHARRPSLAKRAIQWTRRHRQVAWAAAAVLVVAVVALGLGTFLLAREASRTRAQWRRAEENADAARVAARRAENNLKRLRGLMSRIVFWSFERRRRPIRKKVLYELFREYRRSIELDPDDARAHIGLGEVLHAKGDLDAALAAYRKAIEVDPGNSEAYVGVGGVLDDKREIEGAIAAYRKAIELDPENATAHNYLGNALSRKGDLDDAIAAYRKAIELVPEYAPAHTGLGKALRGKGDLDGAIAAYRKAIELDPENALAHNRLGAVLCDDRRRYDEAAMHFREAIRLEPNFPTARYNLGNALSNKGDFDGAMAAYRKAIELDPQYADAYNGLGWAAFRAGGDLDRATAGFRRAIELRPDFVSAHVHLGRTLHAKGDLDGALAAYRKAIELAPEYANAYNNVAWILATAPEARLRDPKRALMLATKAVELAPRRWTCWNTLGVARYRAGDPGAAIEALTRSMELRSGGDGSDWIFLAMAHWQLGHKDKALEWYRKAAGWMEDGRVVDDELIRFRSEAEKLLKVKPHTTSRGND